MAIFMLPIIGPLVALVAMLVALGRVYGAM